MLLRFLKLFFLLAATLSLGVFAFLHGFNAWRAGQIVVTRRGREPFVASADGAFPLTFNMEVWGLMIIGGAVALCGIAGVVKFLIHTPDQRRTMLTRMDGVSRRERSDMDIPWSIGLAIVGAVVAFFVYLGFRAMLNK
ncbi:MAG: hypothetical protein V4645_25700 [Pseudomonadota bacterium]